MKTNILAIIPLVFVQQVCRADNSDPYAQLNQTSALNAINFNIAMMKRQQELDRQFNSPQAKARAEAYAQKQADKRDWVTPVFDVRGELQNADQIPAKFRDRIARDQGKSINELFGHLNSPEDSIKPEKPKIETHRIINSSSRKPNHQKVFSESLIMAKSLYDFMSNQESTEYKRVAEINNTLKLANDPLYEDPNKPLIIAQMVARELRIAPKSLNKRSDIESAHKSEIAEIE